MYLLRLRRLSSGSHAFTHACRKDTTNLRVQIGDTVNGLRRAVDSKIEEWLDVRSAIGFRDLEIEVAALMREVGDEITAAVLQKIVSDEDFEMRSTAACRSALQMRGGGRREVTVTLLGGSTVEVSTPYLKPDRRKLPGVRRRVGRRGPGGSGIYPVLAALGISFGVTAALAGEIVRQVADSDSVRAGRAALARRGIDLGHKQTLRIVHLFGDRAVLQRSEWLAMLLESPEPRSGPLSGKRVVVSTDGGRIRERVPRRGRRSERTRHHRYDAPWREPKLITIYTIDDDGKVDRSFRPIIDGTMDDCDGTFAMLTAYLRGLGCHEAKELEIVGDGALWIWERIPCLIDTIGIAKERVTEVVDWYHAIEVLGKVADVPRWSERDKRDWLARAKDCLYNGDIDGVVALFDEIAKGRRAKAINKHRMYFTKNTSRMNYRAFKKAKLSLGSGSVESAIRRIINLRMKGCGTFWLRDNAESMILLRSYLKVDRFDDFVSWSITRTAVWSPDQPQVSSPVSEVA